MANSIRQSMLSFYRRMAVTADYSAATLLTFAIVAAIYNDIASGYLVTWAIAVTAMIYGVLLLRSMVLRAGDPVTLPEVNERVIELANELVEMRNLIDRNL